MALSDEDVSTIMKHLRAGGVVKHATCASRYIMTWSYEGGEWRVDDWQEGTSFPSTLSEAEMRANIAAAPDEAFASVLGRR